MAKPAYYSPDEVESILAKLKSTLLAGKNFGELVIKSDAIRDPRSAFLYFTPAAWLKITYLVSEFTSEVQWHGLVRRMSDCEYQIYDILVPPHEASSTTVISDDVEYSKWLDELDDDTFKDLRFHGHSHVNMDVYPSSTDDGYRQDLVTQLPKATAEEDSFYIFMIVNKRGEWSAEIYDLKENAIYTTRAKEIEMFVLFEDNTDLSDFMRSARKVVKIKTYTPTYTGTGGYSSSGKGAGGYPYYSGSPNTGTKKKEKKESKNESLPQYDDDYDYLPDGWRGY